MPTEYYNVMNTTMKFILIFISAVVMGCAVTPPKTQAQTRQEIEVGKKLFVDQLVQESMQYANLTNEELLDAMRKAVMNSLKNPDGAQFRGLLVVQLQTGRMVCGLVNEKNTNGEFMGLKSFYGVPKLIYIPMDAEGYEFQKYFNIILGFSLCEASPPLFPFTDLAVYLDKDNLQVIINWLQDPIWP